jgi:hypothetical protein
MSKRGERYKRRLILLRFSGERSLHTGEVVGSIPTAPTIDFKDLGQIACERAHVSPKKSLEGGPYLVRDEGVA